jgi:hypothetical protein
LYQPQLLVSAFAAGIAKPKTTPIIASGMTNRMRSFRDQ